MEATESSCSSCADTSCSAKAQQAGETPEQLQQRIKLQQNLCRIRSTVLVMSGKGGVGKSSTAVNLAVSLARQGQAVGLLDVDIHGPSVPRMMGLDKARPVYLEEEDRIIPVAAQGVKVMSVGFLLEDVSEALIWRGPAKHGVIQQFIRDVDWGKLDVLVVDCPPGTGDEVLSVAQTLGSVSGAVVVTTPQEVALLDVRKSLTFCRQLKMPVLGMVENMSGFACPKCGEVVDIFNRGGGQKLAEETGVPFLGAVPLAPEMVLAGDSGTPFVAAHPGSVTAQAIGEVAEKVSEALEKD